MAKMMSFTLVPVCPAMTNPPTLSKESFESCFRRKVSACSPFFRAACAVELVATAPAASVVPSIPSDPIDAT
jgi:hypothetical protein